MLTQQGDNSNLGLGAMADQTGQTGRSGCTAALLRMLMDGMALWRAMKVPLGGNHNHRQRHS